MKKAKKILSLVLILLMFMNLVPVCDLGIKVNAASEQYLWPIAGVYSMSRGYYNGHAGIDIWSVDIEGKDIMATKSGTIEISKNDCPHTSVGNDRCACNGGCGNYVQIRHDDGTASRYLHLKQYSAHEIGYVEQGTIIGQVGSSGDSSGYHLHFDIYENGIRINSNPIDSRHSYSGAHDSGNIDYIYEAIPHVKDRLPCHFDIKITTDCYVKSLPCSKKSDSNSIDVEPATKGSLYEAVELIRNEWDNLWYKVKTKSGGEDYIFAGNTTSGPPYIRDDDIEFEGFTAPTNHRQGTSYPLTGSISSKYNKLYMVSVYIYSGNYEAGTPETGTEVYLSGYSYNFRGSEIDNKTVFNVLPEGTHTMVVKACFENGYAESDKLYQPDPVTITKKYTFNVVNSGSTHTHSYLSHYEADHPHRVYNKCSCGDWHYTGGTQYVSSCTQCNEPTSILYPNDGIYKIASGVGNNMYLDCALSNSNIQIYENCDGHSNPDFVKSQYFKLTHVGDGWYYLQNTGNGKVVDVYNADSASGTNVQQYDYNGSNAQLFRFYDAGNGYCYIKSKLGCYLDVDGGVSANNTNVQTYTYNGTDAQEWKLQSHSHSYTSSITTYPTCISTGVRTYTCRCGDSYTTTIGTTLHTSVIDPEVKPTTTTTGLTEGSHCSFCGQVLVAQKVIPVLPVMTDIKVVEISRDRLIIGWESGKNRAGFNVYIDYIDTSGKVEKVDFIEYRYDETYYVPASLTHDIINIKQDGSYRIKIAPINSYGYEGQSKTIEVPVITDPSIYGKGYCGDNATWVLDNDGNLVISGTGTMYNGVFAYNQNVKNVVIEEGITNVSYDAFWRCHNLTSIVLPNSLISIGKYAFGETSIESLTIPKNVSHITPGFAVCATMLKSITVDSENEYYSTDGVFLCNKEKTEIVQYPMGLELEYVTIPNNITTIGELAFHFAFHIKNIDSSTNLKYIGDEAFAYCVGLKSFVMPESVEKIGWYAFDCCYQLESVYILSENAEFDDRSMFRRYDKVVGITLVNAYEIAIDLFRNGKNEELSAFADKYIESLPEVESYGTIYCLKNSSAEKYAKEYGIDYVYIDEIYNLGEDTYSFKDYVDDDSQGGHCFGMAVTSSGYFLGLLDGDTVGLAENNSLYSISDNSDIREPICYYNSIQGKVRNDSIVAGGINLKDYNSYDIESDWDAVIEYVKSNEHDEKGNLVIGCTRKSEGGHAVNFLRYRVVEGQERIYAYDNDFPNVETYFYQDANGKIRQAPQSAFSGELDGIALIDVEKYYELAEEFENVRVRSFYAPANSIAIENAYVSVICDNAVEGEYFMYEVFDDVSTVDVIPLVDNATFVYMGNEYSFDEINEDTYGEFTLPSSETDEPMFEVKKVEHAHIYEEAKIEPTCSEKGSTTYTCDCGDTYTETIEANGHSNSEWIIDINSTCSIEGSKHIECVVCGETIETAIIAKLPHNYNSVVTDATCDKTGYTTYICACGDNYIGNETPAKGHIFAEGQSKCSNCDYNKADSCDCKCHKSGIIAKIIWIITNLFNRLLRRNKVCNCGNFHY